MLDNGLISKTIWSLMCDPLGHHPDDVYNVCIWSHLSEREGNLLEKTKGSWKYILIPVPRKDGFCRELCN